MFFAMILSDAGYSLLLMALVVLYWNKLSHNETRRRARSLLLAIGGFSTVYGVLVGSYFGINPESNSVADHLRLLDLNQYDQMIELSITIGALHLLIANFMNVVHGRRFTAKVPALGWCTLIAGGWLYWQQQPDWGTALMIAGVGMILFFSSDASLSSPMSALKRLGMGLVGLTGASKAFGDVMSYMRLFALGLASSSLAITFNELAQQAQEASPGMGLVFSALIILLGHCLNIVLAIVSGVIHGLRLNYIEFFNWALSDEGYPFVPFRKKENEL